MCIDQRTKLHLQNLFADDSMLFSIVNDPVISANELIQDLSDKSVGL